MDLYEWILYYDSTEQTKEPNLVKQTGLETFILLQDIQLAKQVLPDWITNLPVLLHTPSKTAYRGNACAQKLVNIELPQEHVRKLQKMSAKKQKLLQQQKLLDETSA